MPTKAPTLYLRQSCVNDISSSWGPGCFLEVGAGIGVMTRMFLKRGFNGYCQDISSESRRLLSQNLQSFGDKICIIELLTDLPNTELEYLLAFEVLEHIENDLDALKEWSMHLKSQGKIMISVPAHQKKFSKADEQVGHLRRYEKDALFSLMKKAGFKNIKIVNYGFPLTFLSRMIANRLIKNDKSSENMSIKDRSLQSSYSRSPIIKSCLSFLNENLYFPFKYIQRWFYLFELGDGFVAIAEKE